MHLRFVCAAILLSAGFGLPACSAQPPANDAASRPAAAAPAVAPSGLPVIPLRIQANGREHRFQVEVPRTRQEQARGLMFRESLGPYEGMLFPMNPPRPASFWMKNTLIPLDIIFIRPDGTIARIARMTVPHSLDPVPSGEPVAAVLELRGGRAAELGIEEGDTVSWTPGDAPLIMGRD